MVRPETDGRGTGTGRLLEDLRTEGQILVVEVRPLKFRDRDARLEVVAGNILEAQFKASWVGGGKEV